MKYFLILFFYSNLLGQTNNESNIQSFILNDEVKETSGLIYWNKLLWTHNDDNSNQLFGIDPETGIITERKRIVDLKVTDWEDLQQDEKHLYIGDFGNNFKGNRTDLKIFKVSKSNYKIDTIKFSYPKQTDFSKQKQNTTDFDCEAMIVTDSMIYLFSKEWKSRNVTLYKIPNKKGKYEVQKNSTYPIKGLITGAAIDSKKQKIILCGYSPTLEPFLVQIKEFEKDNFLSGTIQKVKMNHRFLQVEGVAFLSDSKIAVTNERFDNFMIKSQPQLFLIDLDAFFVK